MGAPHAPLVLVGPTAAGKSALALALAEATGAEIVAADSVQIYRHLDVGSAKPTTKERARVRHHGLDLLEPSEQSDAGRWLEVADAALRDIAARGRPAIVCGGTGLYVRALLTGLAATPEVPDAVRAELAERLAAGGPEALHRELAEVDPEAAQRIASRDGQRVTRALGVFIATSRPLSAWQAAHREAATLRPATVIGLWPDRERLHARIDARAAAMIPGLLAETEALLAGGLAPDAPGLGCLGYTEAVACLRGELSPADLPAAVALGHRRYAKRQLTWFRRLLREHAPAYHLDPEGADPAAEALLAWGRGPRI